MAYQVIRYLLSEIRRQLWTGQGQSLLLGTCTNYPLADPAKISSSLTETQTMVWQLPGTLRTHAGGETLYVVTSPDDIAAVHKNSIWLVFDGFIKDVMITMNARPMTVEKLYPKPQKHTMTLAELDQNPSAKHFISLTHERYLTQSSPGKHLEFLKDGFLHYLDLEVRLEQLPGEGILSESPKAQKVSLLHLCRDIIVKCNTNIMFGKRLLEIDPGLPKTFCTFDNDHWLMLYKVPRLPARHVHSSQQKIKDPLRAITRYPHIGETWGSMVDPNNGR